MRHHLHLGLAVVVAAFTLAHAAHAEAPGDARDPGVQLLERKVTTARGEALSGLWAGARLNPLSAAIDATCYSAALAKAPAAAGEIVIKMRLGRHGRLSAITATRQRGGTLPATLATCAQRLLAKTTIDMTALPPIEHDPDLPGAIYDLPGDPPPARDLPLRITLRLGFVPRPLPRSCGSSPAGCASKGCPSGLVCDTRQTCKPSSCTCNPESGEWICTRDCGGGVCVPAER
ncbi:MAG: hypothetical protein JNJ59_23090 [Deltaproteobacteria bacterium]|nr:hypothetical protein [Deltaproteobacteria bacterium]